MFYISDAVERPRANFLSHIQLTQEHVFIIEGTRLGRSYGSSNRDFVTTCRDTALRAMVQCDYCSHIWYHFRSSVWSFTEGAWNIARWFYYIEGRMGWQHRTTFNWTHGHPLLKVNFSPTWNLNNASRSLFTLMLRCGVSCVEGSSLEEHLHKHMYTEATTSAIHRFLQGNYYYTGNGCQYNWIDSGSGWYTTFRNADWDYICRVLISADTIKQKAYSLWEQHGCPQNSDQGYFWNRACSELDVKF